MGPHGLWVLRFEGVNFDATLYDTNDISTVRGAGLALLDSIATVMAALERLGLGDLKLIFAGASQAAFRFRAGAAEADTALHAVRAALAEQETPPLRHLMFVADIAPLAGEIPDAIETALDHAQALNRARQFREFTVKLPDPCAGSHGPDPLDHTSQALTMFRMADGEMRKAAPGVVARHDYGRDQRANFYKRADGAALAVCRSLQEMVDAPPRPLPVSARGKVAYLYADGNGFGDIRSRIGTEKFARELERLQTPLLRAITGWLRSGLSPHDRRLALIDSAGSAPVARARLETLLWGGDEFLFVMPAWLGLHFLGQTAAATAKWSIDGIPLTFAFGLVICDVKTPVRQARDTAHKLAETVKTALRTDSVKAATCGAPHSGAAIQVYESQSLIDAPLATQRGLLFGLSPGDTGDLDTALVIKAEALPRLPETIRVLTDEGSRRGALSEAALYAAIKAARDAPGGLLSRCGEAATKRVLDTAFARFGHEAPAVDIPGFVPRGLVLDLCLVAMLRDYCALSEDGELPQFPRLAS